MTLDLNQLNELERRALRMADDAEQAEAVEFTTAPAGRYQVIVDDVELKEARSSGNPMMAWKLRIVSGEHKGSYIWDNVVMSDKAHGMNKGKMAKVGIDYIIPNLLRGIRSGEFKGLAFEVLRTARGNDQNGNPQFNTRWEKCIQLGDTQSKGDLTPPPMDGMPF